MDVNNDEIEELRAQLAKLKAENELIKLQLQAAAAPPNQSTTRKAENSPWTTPNTTPTTTPITQMSSLAQEMNKGIRRHVKKFARKSPGGTKTEYDAAANSTAAAADSTAVAADSTDALAAEQLDILQQMSELKMKANDNGITDEDIKNNLFVQNGTDAQSLHQMIITSVKNKTMLQQFITVNRISPGWYKDTTTPAVTSLYTQTIYNLSDIIAFYKRNIVLPKSISGAVQLLLTIVANIYISYTRLPTVKDSSTTKNLYRGATTIQSSGPFGARPDMNQCQPLTLPILIKDIDNINETHHRKLCNFIGNLTSQLGRKEEHPWEGFMMRFMEDEYMGKHGDYGGKKSDNFFMMRLAIGIGGERTIKFEATELKEGAKNDRDGKVVKDINFSVCLQGGINAYLMSPFASGRNLICWRDDKYTGIRGRHSSRGNGTPSVILVIDFALETLKEVYLALYKFENMTIELGT